MKESINEFFWMWLVSLSPIFLASIWIWLWGSDLSYWAILYSSVEIDIVVGYIATMIAPFLYMLAKWMRSDPLKRKQEKIKCAGFCLALSVVVCILTVLVFSVEKGKTRLSFSNNSQIEVQQVASHEEVLVTQESGFLINIWRNCCDMSSAKIIILICYVLALIIWFYTIWLNNLEPVNLGFYERGRVKERLTDLDSVVGEENS